MKFQFTKTIKSAIASSIFLLLLTFAANATTLLPNGKQIFFNVDGSLCVGCSVYYYIPSTTTFKNTWQDAGQVTLNTNPVITDSAGLAVVYGSGAYRQLFKDALGNTIWDQATSDVTASGIISFDGTSGGSANAQTITDSNFTSTNGQALAFYAGFTNTGPMTITVSGGAAIPLRKDTGGGGGPIVLAGGEVNVGNLVIAYYDSGLGVFHFANNAGVAQLGNANTFAAVQTFTATPVFNDSISLDDGPIITPCGRLTLTTLTPVLTSDVTAATTVFYTPYKCNFVPIYSGTVWKATVFSEVSQTLADATKSPAAATVSNLYDLFVWNDAGTVRVSRGPAWSSATTRGTGAGTTELAMTHGILMNANSITNGPSANRGVYVGTISTSASGANGQLNMMFAPAAAAGGTNNRLDVWNAYNQVQVSSLSRPSDDSWVYNSTAAFRAANASNSNRITIVRGLNDQSLDARYNAFLSSGAGATTIAAIGLDSTTAFSGTTTQAISNSSTMGGFAEYNGYPGIGSHFVQMIESNGGGNGTYYGDNGGTVVQSGLYVISLM